MSTKLYAYKITKDQLWDFVAEAREIFRNIAKDVELKKLRELDEKYKERFYKADAQLFDFETFWIVRILSSDYLVENNLTSKWKQCNYDDRTEVPDEDLPNKEVADRVDVLIAQRKYYIVPISCLDDIILWKMGYSFGTKQ